MRARMVEQDAGSRRYALGEETYVLGVLAAVGMIFTLPWALVIFAEETRSQARNREIARERLAEMIRAALVVPKPRRPTRPTKGSVERRIKAKKVRAEVKAGRGKVEG